MIVINSPDFLSKIFAKYYLTALIVANNTVDRKKTKTTTTKTLNIKSGVFYNNCGSNTKKMPFSNVHTKRWAIWTLLLVPTVILGETSYLIVTWPSPNIFLQDKKWISVKRVSISKFLVKIKGAHFFNLFQITCDVLFMLAYFKLE